MVFTFSTPQFNSRTVLGINCKMQRTLSRLLACFPAGASNRWMEQNMYKQANQIKVDLKSIFSSNICNHFHSSNLEQPESLLKWYNTIKSRTKCLQYDCEVKNKDYWKPSQVNPWCFCTSPNT